MLPKSSRLSLTIVVSTAILFASAGLQAQPDNQRFRDGSPTVAQIGGTSPYYGNETGTNTWYGQGAGASVSSGLHNSFFGYGAGNRTTGGTYPEGSRNSFFGSDAGGFNTTGSHNSFLGSAAGHLNTTGHHNSFFGSYAGYSNATGFENSFFGAFAGYSTTDGYYNSFFGSNAGYSNTGGGYNSFFGVGAGQSNTTGSFNSFFGFAAGRLNTTGWGNTYFGHAAGAVATGNYNSFFGMTAGAANTTGGGNSFFGPGTGYSNTAGNENAFFGMNTGYSNTTGSFNSFFGKEAGTGNTTGQDNSIFGAAAGPNNTAGSYNLFIGAGAGASNTTENNNSFIGTYSNGTAGVTNATAIGYRATVTQSNSLVLGGVKGINNATAEINVGIGVTNPDRQLTVEGSQALGRFRRFNDTTSGHAPAFLFERARGTQAQATDISAGDTLGKVQFRGRVAGNYPEYGVFAFIATDTNQSGRYAFFDSDLATERVSILNTGNVGIGTTTPTERLQVVGNLKVSGQILYGSAETEVPDYVFEAGYRLMPIDELQTFIAKEKHLPNVPASAEIKKDGLNLSEFQMKLLEKIEELTLYTVQQAKMIRDQRSAIAEHKTALERKDTDVVALKTQNSALDARLAALEQMMERLAKREK